MFCQGNAWGCFKHTVLHTRTFTAGLSELHIPYETLTNLEEVLSSHQRPCAWLQRHAGTVALLSVDDAQHARDADEALSLWGAMVVPSSGATACRAALATQLDRYAADVVASLRTRVPLTEIRRELTLLVHAFRWAHLTSYQATLNLHACGHKHASRILLVPGQMDCSREVSA